MTFFKIDRTTEIDVCCEEILVKSTDFCRYYKKHPYTILWRKECWTCSFSDFGIDTGIPTETGVCKYRCKDR